MEIYKLSAIDLQKMIAEKKISIEELHSEFLTRNSDINPTLNTLIEINSCKKGELNLSGGRLHGVPVVVKDNFCTKDIKTTAGSKMLEDFIPPYDAVVVEKCLNEGGWIVGKSNMDEFAMGSDNITSHFGCVRNPHNLSLTPGGSSGGSAAAVAAGFAPIAIGSDTGGSIRLPASHCRVFGMKPTYGRMSRFGMIAYASSLDQAGPIARTTADLALACEIMSGFDQKDSTSFMAGNFSPFKSLSESSKMKIGVPRQLKSMDFEDGIYPVIERVLSDFEKLGHELVDLDIPSIDYSVSCYYLIAMSEASSNLSRFDGVRFGYRSNFSEQPPSDLRDFYSRSRGEGFGKEVKKRILMGTYALSEGFYEEFYNKACLVRRKILDEFINCFDKVDTIFLPTASKLPGQLSKIENQSSLESYNEDAFTCLANLTGMPAISCPLAPSYTDLPLGIQLMSKHFCEQQIFDLSFSLEKQGLIKSEVVDVIV